MGKLDILIVGGGPSSVSAICAIVDQAIEGDFCQKVRVIVVERSGEAGRGLAFGTTDDGHLTNMPAHSLRIPPREKHDFLFVDLHPKPNHPSGFRRNFDEFIVP